MPKSELTGTEHQSLGHRQSWFSNIARKAAASTGRPATFLVALLSVVVWAAVGPLCDFSTNWQLAINTGTTIITFLMVFLIQNTQNRDTAALHIKLDELIRAAQGAHNYVIDLESLDDETLNKIRARYSRIATTARESVEHGGTDTDNPEVPQDPPKG